MSSDAATVTFVTSPPQHVFVVGLVALLLSLPADVMFWRMLIGESWRFFDGLTGWRFGGSRDLDEVVENLLRVLAFTITCLVVDYAVYAGLMSAGRALHLLA